MNIRAGAQSMRIASTEIHESLAAGRDAGFRQAGIKAQAWLTSGRGVEPAGPVRRSHWGAEQATKDQPVAMGGLFTLHDPEKGTTARCHYPGEGQLPPGERINCSCTVIAVSTASGRAKSLDDYLAKGFVQYSKKAG